MRSSLILAVVALVSAAPGLPGVGPADPRVVMDPNQPPWRALGRVQTELGARCTGFLVAPRVAVTAAHCLFSQRLGGFVQPNTVHVLVGYASGVFVGHARALSFTVGPGYDPRQEGRTAGADWAVLRLDAALGADDRILPLSRAPPPVGAVVALGGYERDRAEVIAADRACHVTGWTQDEGGRDLMRHDCAGTSGTSGAPLLAQGPGQSWLVVGVEIAATVGHSGGVAVPAYAVKP